MTESAVNVISMGMDDVRYLQHGILRAASQFLVVKGQSAIIQGTYTKDI